MTGTLTVSGQSTIQKNCKGVCYTKGQDRKCLNSFRKNESYAIQVKNDKVEIKKLNSVVIKLRKNQSDINKAYEEEKRVSENCKGELFKVKKRGTRNSIIIGIAGLIGGFIIGK